MVILSCGSRCNKKSRKSVACPDSCLPSFVSRANSASSVLCSVVPWSSDVCMPKGGNPSSMWCAKQPRLLPPSESVLRQLHCPERTTSQSRRRNLVAVDRCSCSAACWRAAARALGMQTSPRRNAYDLRRDRPYQLTRYVLSTDLSLGQSQPILLYCRAQALPPGRSPA